jgi:hypothetical protein
MSSLSTTRQTVKPVRKSKVLFDSARKAVVASFGIGILPPSDEVDLTPLPSLPSWDAINAVRSAYEAEVGSPPVKVARFHPTPTDAAFDLGWRLGRTFAKALPSADYTPAMNTAFFQGYEQGRQAAIDTALMDDAAYQAHLEAAYRDRYADWHEEEQAILRSI